MPLWDNFKWPELKVISLEENWLVCTKEYIEPSAKYKERWASKIESNI
jgi:hypothetical protein